MEKKMKYPYIGGIDSDCKVLFIGKKHGIAIEHPTLEITGTAEGGWCGGQFKNITSEYLQNTYGEVKSPEHAEFIIELCESNGLSVHHDEFHVEKNFFALNGSGKLFFFPYETQSSINKRKQITIPLPPKADSKKMDS